MSDTVVTARFVADTSSLQAGARKVTGSLQGVQNDVQKSAKGFTMLRGAMGAAFGVAAVAGIAGAARALTGFARESIAAAQEAQLVERRLTAIAQSTGLLDGALGGSTARLTEYADSLRRQTGVSDETIKSAQALMLTFEKVAATAGESGGMFDRATAAALDLAAAGFGSAERNARSLARALSDPVKGLTMLTRSGVMFTAEEKNKIKALVESNRLLEAQELVMAAVEKRVGGVAAATATNMTKMSAAFDEVKETIGFALLPTIESIAGSVNTYVMPALQNMADEAKANGPGMAAAYQDMVPTLLSLGRSFLDIAAQIRVAMQPALQVISRLLQAVVPVVELLAKAIGAIPGPIMAMVGALVVLRMGLMQTFVRTMNTATKTTVLSFATMRTSAATMAAGIRASFIAAGTAVKGFMASLGPVGWALIGASAAFEIFSGRSAATEDLIMRLKETVDEATGAFTELSQVAMATQFRLDLSPSDAAMLAAMGLSVDEAAAAITKGGDAVAEFQAKIDAAQSSMSTGLLPNETAATLLTFERNFQGMADTAVATQERVRAELDSTAAAQARNTSATVSAAIATGNAIGPTSGLTMSIGGLGDEAGEAATEIDVMRQELESWLATTGQMSAVDAAATALEKIGTVSAEVGTNLMGQTPKAREFRGAVIDAFESSGRAAQSLSDDLPTQRAIFTGELVKIVNALKVSGVKPSDIEAFLGSMDDLPASVSDIMRAAAQAIGDTDFKSQVERAFDKSVKAGAPMTADSMEKLAEGASKAAKEKLGLTLEPQLAAIIKSGTTALRPTAFNNGQLTGKSMGSGVANGITSSSPLVIAAIERVMAAAKAAADAAVEAESPSRLFAETGDDMATGVAMGWTRSAPVIYTAVQAVIPRAREEASKFAKGLADAFAQALRGEAGSFSSAINEIFGSIPTQNPLEELLGGEGAAKFVENNEKALVALSQLGAAIDAIVAKVQSAGAAMASLSDMVATPFGQISDLFESFAAGSSIDSVINEYERLIEVLREAYSLLTDASIVGPGAARQNQAILQGHIDYITELTAESVALREEYAANQAAIQALDDAYANQVSEINSRYDAMVAGLQRALSAATEAYNKENQKLQELIRERDGFLQRISDGFRSFVNNLSFEARAAGKQIITETRKIAEGITVALSREIETEGTADIAGQLRERLTAIREFSTNIRSLMERGLDPTLIQDFVSAGVSGAGDAVKQLAAASQDQLNEINSVQRDLASETAGFQSWASAQYHDAAIDQQQAAVAAAEAQVAAANAAIGAAQAARQAELDAAKKAYDEQKAALEERNRQIEARMNEIALAIEARINEILGVLPEQSSKAGQDAIDKMIEGFRKGFPKAMEELGVLMDQLVKSLRRTIRLDIKIGGGSQRAVDAANAAMGTAGMATGAASGVAQALSPDSDSVAGMVEMINASTEQIRVAWQTGIEPIPTLTDDVFADMLSQSLDNGMLTIQLFTDLAASIFESFRPLEDAMHELFYTMWSRALSTTAAMGRAIVAQAYAAYLAWVAIMNAMGAKIIPMPMPQIADVKAPTKESLYGSATKFEFAPVPVGMFAAAGQRGVTVGENAVNIEISVTGSPDDIERQVRSAVDNGFRLLAREVMAS